MQVRRNQDIWAQRRVVQEYEAADGFLDAGERAAFARVAALSQGEPVLDLGVGGGRTVLLLRPLASNYVALDYVPAMVKACARRFPDVDVQLGDARDLRTLPDQSFGLVCFSFNGIDAIDHQGRRRALSEVHRVLKPGGTFWFSTLNLDGMGRRMRPWVPEWPKRKDGLLRFTVRVLRTPSAVARRTRNYLGLKRRFTQGDGWCTGTLSAHDYRLLVHYTTLASELRELLEIGFEPAPVVLDTAGRTVGADADVHDVFWFQILARKPLH